MKPLVEHLTPPHPIHHRHLQALEEVVGPQELLKNTKLSRDIIDSRKMQNEVVLSQIFISNRDIVVIPTMEVD